MDLPPVEWDVEPSRLAHYLGRPKDRALEGAIVYGTWEYPPEDAEDGCPGGWRRSPMVGPIIARVRRRTQDGGRVPNPFFDRIDDDVLLTAVLAFEAHEDAAMAYMQRSWAEEQRRRNKAR